MFDVATGLMGEARDTTMAKTAIGFGVSCAL
jgi:hypothetical protein